MLMRDSKGKLIIDELEAESFFKELKEVNALSENIIGWVECLSEKRIDKLT